jgi:hypothetical protein
MVDTHGFAPDTITVRGKLEKKDFKSMFIGIPYRSYGEMWKDAMEMDKIP